MKLVPENLIDPKSIPAPPNLVRSFSTGFDTISNHLWLILFPVVLDLLLWWGPRLRIENWLRSVLREPSLTIGLSAADSQEMLKASMDLWLDLSSRFNLLTILRTYPVGVTSLMAGISPVGAPSISGPVLEATSLLAILGWVCGLGLVGLGLGTIFYTGVSRAVLQKKVIWREVFQEWPVKYLRVVTLTLLWLMLFLSVSMLFSCLLTLLTIVGFGIGSLTIILYGFVMVWLLIPLAFSAHGIFVYDRSVLDSIKESARLTRLTMPTTVLFLLALVLLSQGLNMIWALPDETSWMNLVGILGHGFVSTALLAASFVYYRDASQWVKQVLHNLQSTNLESM